MSDSLIQPVSPLPDDPHLDAAEVSQLATSAGAATRMLADSEADASVLSGALPTEELAARVAHERVLREAVGRVMVADRAPEALRAAVAQAMREQVALGSISADAVADPAPRVLNAGGLSRSRSFWERSAGWLTAAAVLGLAGIGIYGGLRPTLVAAEDGFSPEYRQNLVHFVEEDHRSCDPNCAEGQDRFTARCTSEASETIEEALGSVPAGFIEKIEKLHEAGYSLDGLGRSGMPGDGPSVHVLLTTPSHQRASLFVQVRPSTGVKLQTNCCYTSERCNKSGSQMMAWRNNGYIYYLYSNDLAAQREIAALFRVPSERRSF